MILSTAQKFCVKFVTPIHLKTNASYNLKKNTFPESHKNFTFSILPLTTINTVTLQYIYIISTIQQILFKQYLIFENEI